MLGPKIYRLTYDIPANIVFPKMIRTHLEQGIASCATGYDRNIIKRTLGEALERHLAFSDADAGGPNLTLSEMDPLVSDWFIRNSRLKLNEHQIQTYRFSTTEVTELPSGERHFAPLVAFNLGQSKDDNTFGFRDSSGSALHQSLQQAFIGSRDEYCERQALSLFWYFGHCLSSLELKDSELYEKLKNKLGFIRPLLTSGRILLYDISYFSPVRTILSVYVSDIGNIRFAAGASGNKCINEAAHKSLLEMYQALVLMGNITDERAKNLINLDDSIIEGYLKHNCQETVDKFIDIHNIKKSQTKYVFPDSIDFRIEFCREPIFLHQKEVFFSDKKIYFCVMKSIQGFKTMSIEDVHCSNTLAAARRYGYTKITNTGPIPFA
ncbi:YcaO-like family protein [Pectobacterium cacticida]|uniref:YcaO-like family protein n=1 Tax=Pectobacterium cacticida TaxID=69221 RepID=UPI002FF2D757